MERKILKNKPLIEAILEIKWELKEITSGVLIDPHYKILVGRIYDKIHYSYPYHEQLPTSVIPDEIASYIVQHRFRKGKNEWPLIQLGPGIITLNSTTDYVWEDFEKRIKELIDILFKTYPEDENKLVINNLALRYIDAVEIDFQKGNLLEFLDKNLKINVMFHKELFEKTGVNSTPEGLDLRFSFGIKHFESVLNVRFLKGKKNDLDAIIWETQLQSLRKFNTNEKEDLIKWIENAHNLTDLWFFSTIEGELIKRFE